ncbi:MerR family transcriptional regulator [Aerococcus agrisoli]|uniref:MerR family transcriptional regulator n=1 Tax=Aerococcus agrisoli TaxID=2487350 RepID=A0A3N4GF05_9LACT|nr:MerR family transcriptional regulator [Aerococcus agrisoli]RPA60468.1 MerR family transcriptional regulator [Aerococcus agrisoli]
MYTIGQVAKMTGLTHKTLRYYDSIGLLTPSDYSDAGYRLYAQADLDRLQQILLYREMGLSLDAIKQIIYAPDFDVKRALSDHLAYLDKERQRLDTLIHMVNKTLIAEKEGLTMSNEEKFEAMKETVIRENENQYGVEIRAKYGGDIVDASEDKLRDADEASWQSIEELNDQLNSKLAEAVALGDPSSDLAQEVCDLHRQWLTFYWPDGMYDASKHAAIVDMYQTDDRFKAYYEKIAPGATDFLHRAMTIYLAGK